MTKPWIILALLAHGCATSSIKKEPLYTTMYKDGSKLTLQCTGTGPSEDVAFQTALDSCRQSAGNTINSQLESNSLIIETEHSGAYHSEVSRKYSVAGLDCLKLKATTENIDGSYLSRIECDFNLNNAKIVPISANAPIKYVHGKNRHIVLSSIPPCQDLVITGESARSIKCTHNPVIVLIKSTDQELIIRSKDRIPKHIPLSEISETIEVYLERM